MRKHIDSFKNFILNESLFSKNNIEKILDNIGLSYQKDKEYYYTNQKDGFTFKISRLKGDIWVKSGYFGNNYKIDYTDNLENYIKTILNEKPDLSKLKRG